MSVRAGLELADAAAVVGALSSAFITNWVTDQACLAVIGTAIRTALGSPNAVVALFEAAVVAVSAESAVFAFTAFVAVARHGIAGRLGAGPLTIDAGLILAKTVVGIGAERCAFIALARGHEASGAFVITAVRTGIGHPGAVVADLCGSGGTNAVVHVIFANAASGAVFIARFVDARFIFDPAAISADIDAADTVVSVGATVLGLAAGGRAW